MIRGRGNKGSMFHFSKFGSVPFFGCIGKRESLDNEVVWQDINDREPSHANWGKSRQRVK